MEVEVKLYQIILNLLIVLIIQIQKNKYIQMKNQLLNLYLVHLYLEDQILVHPIHQILEQQILQLINLNHNHL